MSDTGARLGIGIVTCNRLPYLKQAVQQVTHNTVVPFDLVIADDGSSDGTPQWASASKIPIVTGGSRGYAWNKNRALLYLAMFSECDVIVLLEDCMWPVEPDWHHTWYSAAERWQHVIFGESAAADHQEAIIIDEDTDDCRHQAVIRSWQCTATTREALARIGYLNTQFQDYGYCHTEWSGRFRAAYGHEWAFPDDSLPCLNVGLGDAWIPARALNASEIAQDRQIYEKMAAHKDPLKFVPPWSTDAERQALLQEVIAAHETPGTARLIDSYQRPDSTELASHGEVGSGSVTLNLFTDQLIAFRHYLHAVFHLRPLMPVQSASLVFRGGQVALSPTYKGDHVVLEGYGLIESIAQVENAELDLRTAVGTYSISNLVTKDLQWVDPFNLALDNFVRHVHSDHFDVLEIGSRRRLATVFDPGFRTSAKTYTGIDILDGPNVDIVCDAHRMSEHVGKSRFDIVYSQYVFEHLAMPWVAVAEINKALRIHGECFITTNQSIGLHDLPWDFWRFSESAWHALFNEDTGFELVTCGLGEPVHITPRRYHAGFREHEGGVGYQASFAWARKIRDLSPTWPVDPDRIFARLSRAYPREITD